MTLWLQVLVKVLLKKCLNPLVLTCKRRVAKILLLVFLGLALLGSLVFVAVGAYLSLQKFYAPWISGLIIGGGLLAFALIVSFVLWTIVNRGTASKPAPSMQSDSEQEAIFENASHLGEIIGGHLSRHGIKMVDLMVAALMAGTVLGASQALRTRCRSREGRSGGSSDSTSPDRAERPR